ncbi:hypothetical protein L1987_64120 [Smallanthus sonchifolius]|uniref:Uncharacterized protein n=1 Tax=Smallanthus sonchifolius TaxID=185202 RepID=A0ACB9CF33_9ASTR|nr:hypothetical protein L1987_64120 [Smallanthus sonchifolius]
MMKKKRPEKIDLLDIIHLLALRSDCRHCYQTTTDSPSPFNQTTTVSPSPFNRTIAGSTRPACSTSTKLKD